MSSNALPPKLVSSDILVRLCVMSSSTFFEELQAAEQSSLWIRGEVHFPTSRALQNREFDLPFVNLPQNLIFSGHAAKAFAQYLSSSEQRKKKRSPAEKQGQIPQQPNSKGKNTVWIVDFRSEMPIPNPFSLSACGWQVQTLCQVGSGRNFYANNLQKTRSKMPNFPSFFFCRFFWGWFLLADFDFILAISLMAEFWR